MTGFFSLCGLFVDNEAVVGFGFFFFFFNERVSWFWWFFLLGFFTFIKSKNEESLGIFIYLLYSYLFYIFKVRKTYLKLNRISVRSCM